MSQSSKLLITNLQALGAINTGGMCVQVKQMIGAQLKLVTKNRCSIHVQFIEGKQDTVKSMSESSSQVFINNSQSQY